jgi:3-oxoacyl-[acyl-carrier protein] reductase
MRFQDRVAIVTGAASGFGREIALRFAAEGAAVVAGDQDDAGGKEVVAAIEAAGGRALFQHCDVSQGDQVEALVGAALAHYGGLHAVINNAGFSHRMGAFWELPEADYDRVFAVNTKSVYWSAVHAVPALIARGGGAIVNTASIGAIRPRPGLTAYNATKGAVVTMTRGLAAEVARFKIRVNAVLPVAADTGFMRGVWGESGLPDPARKAAVDGIPLGRLALPRDVAGAVLFLASDDASFLTGVCLDVDGGRSIA